MTHTQVASMVFTGPMEHLFILTQTNVGIQKNGHISDLTSLPSSFSFLLKKSQLAYKQTKQRERE